MSSLREQYKANPQAFFLSSAMKERIDKLSRTPIIGIGPYLREQGFAVTDREINARAAFKTNVVWQPENPAMGWTDKRSITINVGSEHIVSLGSLEEQVLTIEQVMFHEDGHILFTDFPTGILWVKNLSDGKLLPKPKHYAGTPEEKILTAWLQRPELAAFVASIAKDIENCMEDGYIERELRAAYPGRVGAALAYGAQQMWGQSSDFAQDCEDARGEGKSPLLPLRNQILLYAKYKVINCNDASIPEYAILENILGILDEVAMQRDPQERVRAVNDVLCALVPVLEQSIQEALQNQSGQDDQKGEEGDEQEGNGDGKSKSSSESNGGHPQSGGGQASGASQPGSAQPQSGEGGTSSGQSGCAGDEDPFRGLSDDEIKDAVRKILDDIKNGIDAGPEPMCKDKGTSSLTHPGLSKNMGAKGEVPQSGDANTQSSGSEKGKERVRALVNEVLREIEQETTEKQETANMAKEAQKFDLRFIRPDITQDVIERYNELYKGARTCSKAMQRKILELFQDRRETTKMRHLFIGRRFDTMSITANDGRHFQKTTLPTDRPRLRVDIIIDQSGSTQGRIIEAEQIAAIAMTDFCTAMGIRCRVLGYSSNGITSYVEPTSKNAKRDKFRLASNAFHSGGSTPTAKTLEYAVAQLDKAEEESKLLLVMTDGVSDEGDIAIQRVLKDAKRKQIAVIAMGLGSDAKTIQQEFGTDNFANIGELSTLPKRLIQLIRRYMPLA